MLLCLSIFAVLTLSVCVVQSGRIVEVATPVLFTNGLQSDISEESDIVGIEVPVDGDLVRLFDAGGPVYSAWWVPFEDITDVTSVYKILTWPDGNSVELTVRGNTNQKTGRMRILIYAYIKDEVNLDKASDVARNVSRDIAKNVAINVTKNLARDIAKEVAREVAKEVARDIAKDVAREIANAVAINVTKNIVKDVIMNITKDVVRDIATDIARDVATNITSSWPQDLQLTMN